MRTNTKRIGVIAEAKASDYLSKQGYVVIKRNFSNRFGEIDIIAKEKETFIFVEVKAKTGDRFGLPEDMVTASKLARVRHMAQVYMGEKNEPCRIDVIAIVLDNSERLIRLTHYKNVS